MGAIARCVASTKREARAERGRTRHHRAFTGGTQCKLADVAGGDSGNPGGPRRALRRTVKLAEQVTLKLVEP